MRRVRQTLLATKLAQGALVAWHVPEEKLEAAFDWMKEHDPFTGHVVLRNTDHAIPGPATGSGPRSRCPWAAARWKNIATS